MSEVTVSPKFQIVIPREVRDALRIRPGEKLRVFEFENRIELVPVRPIRELRGSLKGIDTTVERDADRL
jgi:AbrB family looped-hinge helix DNA binding protein